MIKVKENSGAAEGDHAGGELSKTDISCNAPNRIATVGVITWCIAPKCLPTLTRGHSDYTDGLEGVFVQVELWASNRTDHRRGVKDQQKLPRELARRGRCQLVPLH
ncbi:hypothetical protein MRX96_043586 [Rhipicephalus microplus]